MGYERKHVWREAVEECRRRDITQFTSVDIEFLCVLAGVDPDDKSVNRRAAASRVMMSIRHTPGDITAWKGKRKGGQGHAIRIFTINGLEPEGFDRVTPLDRVVSRKEELPKVSVDNQVTLPPLTFASSIPREQLCARCNIDRRHGGLRYCKHCYLHELSRAGKGTVSEASTNPQDFKTMLAMTAELGDTNGGNDREMRNRFKQINIKRARMKS